MASKERIQRLKEETRVNILEASLDIVKEEGWQSLSMRKIADKIEYTAPIIYEYFANKDAILNELTRQGYVKLTREMQEARDSFTSPKEQLEAMWLSYWNFAFANKELYQVMYGVEMNCCTFESTCPDMKGPADMLWDKIEEIIPVEKRTEDYICTKYYTFWSVIHGLISINITGQTRQTSEDINKQVLKDAITGIIHSMDH